MICEMRSEDGPLGRHCCDIEWYDRPETAVTVTALGAITLPNGCTCEDRRLLVVCSQHIIVVVIKKYVSIFQHSVLRRIRVFVEIPRSKTD